jgi:CheY-like chemotaxis protein
MEEKKTILVVEDDTDSRAAIVAILEALGYGVVACASGQEALKTIPGKRLNLALLDIMMPEMNGYELLQVIRTMPEFAELPIIMVTARDADSEIIEGYKYGADYYITKPFTSKQLDYGIRVALGLGHGRS